jgi:hypothetical protein
MTLTPSSPAGSTSLNTAAEPASIAALRDLRASTCNPVGAPTVTAELSENIILTSLDDLLDVPGIGPATLESMRPHLRPIRRREPTP